jgi:diguanylate cyclase (GGDEF)-like protein
MDLNEFVKQFKPMTCIISVETFPDGSYGNIRIITGNEPYLASTQRSFGKEFVPDMPYEHYMLKDLNFEDFCYRCAVLGKTLHTYIHPERFDFWISLTMIPVASDKENIHYCAYTQELSKKADSELMSDLSVETSNAVIRTCIKLKGADDFQETMNEVIADIRDICDASHCCILLSDFTNRKCSVLCEALSATTTLASMKKYVNDDFFAIVDTWPDTIAGSTCVIIKDDHDWAVLKERNPVWYESMLSAGAESIVLFPLRAGSDILGFIWAINFNVENVVQIKETLELTSFILASEVATHQLFKRLEQTSSMDVLTGVFNRNAMNNRVDSLCAGEPKKPVTNVGIVFADLNGLKRVNDNQGHYAGDLLLKNAALILQKHFQGCEIYRAGGDEFMILAPDIPEERLEEMIEELRADTSDPDSVCFALGSSTASAESIRKALRAADERMYADKKEFYHLHPELKR